jgi:SAM-dependent methyltransferase
MNLDNTPVIICEACGKDTLRKFEVPGVIVLQYCPECDFYQKGVPITASTYEKNYHEHYARRREEKMKVSFARLQIIRRLLKNEKCKILDIGCSVGYVVEVAKNIGWDASGVDLDDEVIKFCTDRGLDCTVFDGFNLPFPDNSFDCVTAWHVIEHVEDAEKTLREWLRVLRPGGLLVIETPNAACRRVRKRGLRYKNFWPAEHLYSFSPKALKQIILHTGVEIIPTPLLCATKGLTIAKCIFIWGYQFLEICLKPVMGTNKAFQMYVKKK